MRKIGRRAAAMISAAALGAGCFLPAGVQAAPEITVREQSPRQAELSVAVSLPEFRQDDFTGELTAVPVYEASEETPQLLAQTGELPSSFDLRAEKTMSPVRDQSGFGTCWAHSACASAEATLIGAVPDVDLSEFHTAYYAYEGDDQIDLGDMELTERMNYGGTADIVTNLWAQWIGPVKEERVPYGDLDFFSSDQAGAMKYLADYHLENAYIFDYNWEHDNTEEVGALIKELVYSGIPVDISFYNDPSQCYSALYKSTNSKKRPRFANHSVTIAGWDDSFPKDHFTIPAENDGAWLVKNSWGAKYGSGGYMWISYEDASLSECVAYELTDKNDYQYNHQHDTYVPVQSLCAWEDVSQDTGSYMANVFPIYGDEEIGAVSTYIRSPGTDYEITVYTGLTDPKNPMSGTASAVTSGTLTELGYQTIGLNAPVSLTKGELFSVVVKLTNANKEYLIPIEYATHSEWTNFDGSVESSNSVFTEEMLRRSFAAGQSFYSADGSVWYDMSEVAESGDTTAYDDGTSYTYRGITGNICLKAVVNVRGAVTFSDYCEKLPIGEEITLSCIEDTPIHYSVNDGEYQLYSGPITYNGEMTIKAYADTDVNTIYEMHYTTARSELTSLLGIENTFSDYFFTNEGEKDTLRYNVYEGTTTLDVLPVANGKITIGDTTLPSGEITTLDLKHGVTTFDLQVEQPDLEPTTYRLIVNEMLSIMYGDVNEDGDINSVDASEVLVYAAITGLGQDAGKSEDWKQRADYNRDGQIDSSDASSILVFAAQAGLYS